MAKIERDLRGVITVKLAADHMRKLDRFANKLQRSRADMIRVLISEAMLTGQSDVAVNLPVPAGIDAA